MNDAYYNQLPEMHEMYNDLKTEQLEEQYIRDFIELQYNKYFAGERYNKSTFKATYEKLLVGAFIDFKNQIVTPLRAHVADSPEHPEINLIYKIVRNWGNAAQMGNMPQWLKDYAKNVNQNETK